MSRALAFLLAVVVYALLLNLLGCARPSPTSGHPDACQVYACEAGRMR